MARRRILREHLVRQQPADDIMKTQAEQVTRNHERERIANFSYMIRFSHYISYMYLGAYSQVLIVHTNLARLQIGRQAQAAARAAHLGSRVLSWGAYACLPRRAVPYQVFVFRVHTRARSFLETLGARLLFQFNTTRRWRQWRRRWKENEKSKFLVPKRTHSFHLHHLQKFFPSYSPFIVFASS